MNFNIAIDGPAGAGKSTIAKRVAKALDFIYVDTGAMYRAMALYFLQQNIKSKEIEKIKEACSHIHITIEYKNGEQQVLLNQKNVTAFIRTEEVGKMASCIATQKAVRIKLVELQRQIAKESSVVMDGRDIGTEVLPNANIKIYLTASSSKRANRRWIELKEKGVFCDLDEIEKDIIARDEQDMNREFSPLRQAADAIFLDSSFLNIEQVVEKILEIYKEKE